MAEYTMFVLAETAPEGYEHTTITVHPEMRVKQILLRLWSWASAKYWPDASGDLDSLHSDISLFELTSFQFNLSGELGTFTSRYLRRTDKALEVSPPYVCFLGMDRRASEGLNWSLQRDQRAKEALLQWLGHDVSLQDTAQERLLSSIKSKVDPHYHSLMDDFYQELSTALHEQFYINHDKIIQQLKAEHSQRLAQARLKARNTLDDAINRLMRITNEFDASLRLVVYDFGDHLDTQQISDVVTRVEWISRKCRDALMRLEFGESQTLDINTTDNTNPNRS
jgi:hypothetical protein